MKTIFVNENDIKSIKKGERLKTKYENMGLNLVESKFISFSVFVLVYK